MLNNAIQTLRRKLFGSTKEERHALVGPSQLWKMKREFQLSFLKQAGLLPHHYLLDIGCGTLRGGIPLIKYLEAGHYYGMEERKIALKEAISELREEGITDKNPVLIHSGDFKKTKIGRKFDIIWAFSVLIHLTDDLLSECLIFVSRHLKKNGVFYANINQGEGSYGQWQGYPVVRHSLEFYQEQAKKAGLTTKTLGTLLTLGHNSGVENQDEQIMLKFTIAPHRSVSP